MPGDSPRKAGRAVSGGHMFKTARMPGGVPLRRRLAILGGCAAIVPTLLPGAARAAEEAIALSTTDVIQLSLVVGACAASAAGRGSGRGDSRRVWHRTHRRTLRRGRSVLHREPRRYGATTPSPGRARSTSPLCGPPALASSASTTSPPTASARSMRRRYGRSAGWTGTGTPMGCSWRRSRPTRSARPWCAAWWAPCWR